MPVGPVYQWSYDNFKLVLEIGSYGPGEYVSAPVWPWMSLWEQFFFYVWVREVTGTSPGITSYLDTTTDDVNSLSDDEITWTEAPGSASTTLTGPGSTTSNFQIPSADTYQRARTIITGEDTVMACRVILGAIPVLENPSA